MNGLEHESGQGPGVVVATAGWAIPRTAAALLAGAGSHLERYAARFEGVEINSCFYRAHARATYERWARVTPVTFRFAVKLPRVITHDLQLRRCAAALDRFLDDTSGLGAKRGPMLVQLPPSHVFDARVTARFLGELRRRYAGPVACEPRHPSWFTPRADRLLADHQVARAAADPGVVPAARRPGGWPGLTYLRWHGSPHVYWSRYAEDEVRALARALTDSPAAERWCVFDNTAAGAALENARELQAALGEAR